MIGWVCRPLASYLSFVLMTQLPLGRSESTTDPLPLRISPDHRLHEWRRRGGGGGGRGVGREQGRVEVKMSG